MVENFKIIEKLLNILKDGKTTGNSCECFTELISVLSELNSNLILFIKNPFTGMDENELEYSIYVNNKCFGSEKFSFHFRESKVIKEIDKENFKNFNLKDDKYLNEYITNIIKINSNDYNFYGKVIKKGKTPIAFVLEYGKKQIIINSEIWCIIEKVIFLLMEKLLFLYEEKDKIYNILSTIAYNLQKNFFEEDKKIEHADVLQQVLESSARLLHAEKCALFLVDYSKKILVLERVTGNIKPEKIRVISSYSIENYNLEEKGTGVTPWVWYRKKPFNAKNFDELISHSEGHWKGNWDKALGYINVEKQFQCVYMVPLLAKNEAIGVLKYENRKYDDSFTDNKIKYFNQSEERLIDIIGGLVTNLVISERIERNKYDKVFPEISETLLSLFGQENYYEELLEKCRNILDAGICSLFLVEKDDSLALKAIVGVPREIKEELKGFCYPDYTGSANKDSIGLTPWILIRRKSFNVRSFPDLKARSEKKHLGKWDTTVYHGQPEKEFSSLYSIPLIIGDEPIGVLKIENKKSAPYYFTESDERLFDLIGRLIAIGFIYDNEKYRGQLIRGAEIGFLTSAIAHEFNNYLHAFSAISSNIKDLNKNKEIEEDIDSLIQAIKKADKMIENFKEIRNRKVGITEFDLDDLIKQLIDISKKRFEYYNIKLTYHNTKISKVELNNFDIQSILVNLLNNAFDAVLEKETGNREIVLSIDSHTENLFSIEIEDSGNGVPENIKDQVFFPFFSTKSTTGMGMGLFWVQRLTTDMLGKITLEKKSHLGGAKFKVVLPIKLKAKGK